MSFPELRDLPAKSLMGRLDLLIEAVKTEDEIGMVLRLHLLLEQFLAAYIAWKITPEMKKFVQMPRNFGDKLAMAVAFGLNLPLSDSIYHFNKIRNRLSHGAHSRLEKEWVQDYLRASKLVARLQGYDSAVIEKQVGLGQALQEPGQGDYRRDVFLAWMTCWHAILDSMRETNSAHK